MNQTTARIRNIHATIRPQCPSHENESSTNHQAPIAVNHKSPPIKPPPYPPSPLPELTFRCLAPMLGCKREKAPDMGPPGQRLGYMDAAGRPFWETLLAGDVPETLFRRSWWRFPDAVQPATQTIFRIFTHPKFSRPRPPTKLHKSIKAL